MAIEFRCDACGKSFRTNKTELVGKRVRCPGCQQPVLVKPVGGGEAIQTKTKKAPPSMATKPQPEAVQRARPPQSPSNPFEDEGPPPDMPRSPRRERPKKSGIDALGVIVGLVVCVYLAAMLLVLFGVVGGGPELVVAKGPPFGQPLGGNGPIVPIPKNNGPLKPKPKPIPKGKPLPPQGAPIDAKGTVAVGLHKIEMKASEVYVIKVKGEGFRPSVRMLPDYLPSRFGDKSRDTLYEGWYSPTTTRTQSIRIAPILSQGKSSDSFRYSLDVKTVALSPKPIFEKQDSFVAGKHSKSYKVKLSADDAEYKYYVIDMKRRGNSLLNCRLQIVSEVGRMHVKYPDIGDGSSCRIVLRVGTTQTFEIVAIGPNESVGDFTLSVRSESSEASKSKSIVVKRELTPAIHQFRPKLNQVNVIECEGNGFRPYVTIRPGSLPTPKTDAKRPHLSRSHYVATKPNETLNIFIKQGLFDKRTDGSFDYSLKVLPVELAKKPLLETMQEMTKKDPPIDVTVLGEWPHHKAYKIKLVAGKWYVAYMKIQPKDFMTCRLAFLAPDGKVAAIGRGYDRGNTLLAMQAPQSGIYTLIAASLGDSIAPYTLQVYSQIGESKEPIEPKTVDKKPEPLPPVAAGTPIIGKGKISLGEYEVPMKASALYVVKVVGEGFQPEVDVKPGVFSIRPALFGAMRTFEGVVAPTKTETQSFRIGPYIDDVKGPEPSRYSFSVKPIALSAKPLLEKHESLTNTDLPFKTEIAIRKHHKSYPVKMQTDLYYVIEMKRRGKSPLECYLYVLDPKGKSVANDSGLSYPESRIVFRPKKTEVYQVIAAGLGDAIGDFTLTVYSTSQSPSNEKPIDLKGEIKAAVHAFQPLPNQLNVISIVGEGFRPNVGMQPGRLPTLASLSSAKENQFENYYIAAKANETQTLVIVPDLFSVNSKGPHEYALKITPVALSAKAMIDATDELKKTDPPIKVGFTSSKHHKAYTLKLTAGKYYVAEMTPQNRDDFLTCGMALLDANHKVVAQSNGYGNGNARLVVQAPQSETFRLIAYEFGRGIGAFELTVREQAE